MESCTGHAKEIMFTIENPIQDHIIVANDHYFPKWLSIKDHFLWDFLWETSSLPH